MKSEYEVCDDTARLVGGALIGLVLLSGGVLGGALFLLVGSTA